MQWWCGWIRCWPTGYLQRARTERKHRRIGVRPAPDTMAVLTGYRPVEQGIACYAELRQHADGVCERGNYVREMPGWQINIIDAGLLGTHRMRSISRHLLVTTI